MAEAFSLLYQLPTAQGDKIGHSQLSSFFKYSSRPPLLLLPLLFLLIWLPDNTFVESIIEQCQRLRLETAECGCSTIASRGASKDRKVIYHWHNGQTRCHYLPRVLVAFPVWSAANATVGFHRELQIGWKKTADWIYGGSHTEKFRGVCDGLFCHSVWIPRGNELFSLLFTMSYI